MQFHARFQAAFSAHQLAVIRDKAAAHAVNADGEVYTIIMSTDKVYAELYADDATSNTLSIMDFATGPISAARFWALLAQSVDFPPLDIWHAG